MKTSSLFSLASTSVLGLATCLAPTSVSALCLDLNCTFFEPSTPSSVTHRMEVQAISGWRYLQAYFNTTSAGGVTISNAQWSYDDITYNAFGPNPLVVPDSITNIGTQIVGPLPIGEGTVFQTPGTPPSNNDFVYFRYTINATTSIQPGEMVSGFLRGNSDGTTYGTGFLESNPQGSNSFAESPYRSTARETTGVPTPLPLFGVGVTLSFSRKLRSRLKTKG